MKTTIAITMCLTLISSALALPPVRPTLPSVEHADVEATTNVSFMAWQENAGRFTFSLTCRATPTNNVQAAFGTDADGDGVLSLEESDLVVGWDCGEWFVQNGFDGERVESVVGALPDVDLPTPEDRWTCGSFPILFS